MQSLTEKNTPVHAHAQYGGGEDCLTVEVHFSHKRMKLVVRGMWCRNGEILMIDDKEIATYDNDIWHSAIISDFVSALRKNGKPRSTIQDGYNDLSVAVRIEEALKSG
jgi:hypothetical protein